jgi:hypothetical protein
LQYHRGGKLSLKEIDEVHGVLILQDLDVGSVTVHKIDKLLTISLDLSDKGLRLNLGTARGAIVEAGLFETFRHHPGYDQFRP